VAAKPQAEGDPVRSSPKGSSRWARAVRCTVAGMVVAGVTSGCAVMLYPLARAFGSPSQGELQRCRYAFARFQATRATVTTVAYAPIDPRSGARHGGEAALAVLRERLPGVGVGRCVVAGVPPDVEPTPLGHNQLRYAWTRARLYAAWARDARPAGDFFVVVEILSAPSGEIVGVHGYVVERGGQVAFVRWLNSHSFGTGPPRDAAQACALILDRLQRSLARPAAESYPRYGVG